MQLLRSQFLLLTHNSILFYIKLAHIHTHTHCTILHFSCLADTVSQPNIHKHNGCQKSNIGSCLKDEWLGVQDAHKSK